MVTKEFASILVAAVALTGLAPSFSGAAHAYGFTEYGWNGSTIALPTPPKTPIPTYVWVFNPETGTVRIYYHEPSARVSPPR